MNHDYFYYVVNTKSNLLHGCLALYFDIRSELSNNYYTAAMQIVLELHYL